ncbi:MAG TPA: hypothetical protein VNO14_06565 [Blastocatellia bacterium]|nr:hypothetical protein [Blastocatellia bacterium]
MAVSLINTECKRYGCIKNLLACYANCRYNTRCDDLRDEIEGKAEQATKDINQYLGERGRPPIAIQFMKRGLKFTKASSETPEPVKPKQVAVSSNASLKLKGSQGSARKVRRAGSAKKKVMVRKAKNAETRNQEAQAPTAAALSGNGDSKVEKKPARKKSRSREAAPARSSVNGSRKNSKTYIILEGKSARLVDANGLMEYILSGSSTDSRYFEATEVEARLQIVARR